MMNARASHPNPLAGIVLYSIFFLFFFQLLADFVEAIYVFGLLGTGIPIEIISVLFLFSPLLLQFFKNGLPGRGLIGLGTLVLAARLLEVMLTPRGKMLVAGFGVSCFLVFFPLLLRELSRRNPSTYAGILGGGLTLATAVSILFRTLYSGTDISTQGFYQLIGWIFAVVALLLMPGEILRAPGATSSKEVSSPGSAGKLFILTLGLASVFVLLYFVFTSPTVIARWTGSSYLLIVFLIAVALSAFSLVLAGSSGLFAGLSRRILWSGNILFAASLVFSILPHQISFSADPGAYPLYEPETGAWPFLPPLLMLILFPVILVNFTLFIRQILAFQPGTRALGGAFTLASLYILIMIFAHVFTTVYAYIPLVGPFFRDKFWLVHLVPGLFLILPLVLVDARLRDLGPIQAPRELGSMVTLVGVAAVIGILVTMPRPVAPREEGRSMRVLTYNVQQGYSEDGLRNFDGQLALIRSLNLDIVGLQETDNARISGGNADVVRYFTDRLNMFSYYGPKSVPGTFGIALLSKYPIQNPSTFYMYSVGEQTATIHAEIEISGKLFNVYVTHLGNQGPIEQQEAILQEVAGRENVILVGDFNFRPDTEQYLITTAVLEDAWMARWPSGVDDEGVNPERRIDHIFLSPTISVMDARYIFSPASDHPALVAEIGW